MCVCMCILTPMCDVFVFIYNLDAYFAILYMQTVKFKYKPYKTFFLPLVGSG